MVANGFAQKVLLKNKIRLNFAYEPYRTII